MLLSYLLMVLAAGTVLEEQNYRDHRFLMGSLGIAGIASLISLVTATTFLLHSN